MSIVSAFTYYVNLNIMNKLHFYFFSKEKFLKIKKLENTSFPKKNEILIF